MLNKYRNLIKLFPANGSAITAKELAMRLGVSTRSVVSYVGEILSEYPRIIKPTGKGYLLNADELHKIEVCLTSALPDTPEKRALYMIRRILENESKSFSIEDFEEELFVGESTIRKGLPFIRQKLKEFDLIAEHKEGIFIIKGDESNKRKMLSEAIYLEFNEKILSFSAVGKAFPNYDAAALKDLLINVCNEYRYFINEFALMNLVLDLLISIDRIKNNHLTLPGKRIHRFGAREQDLAKTIIRNLEALYGVEFNQLETDELIVLLFSRLTKVDYKTLTLENIHETLSSETIRIVELIKQELGVFDFLDFSNAEFMLCFMVHIDNLLKRLANNYITINPLTEQIKNGCTFIYELSVLIAGIINRETGCFVNQHETAYVAIHIGGMLQIQQSLRNKARCILVFPNYYDYANRLMEQLTAAFGTSLVFEGVVTNAEDISRYGSVDMILSTVEERYTFAAEVVNINPFLRDLDRLAIQNAIDRVVRKKRLERVRKSLLEISNPEMFSINKDFVDEGAAIRFMAAEMISRGYGDKSFLSAVFEREKSYSTAYGDIAIPHALQMDAIKTGMYICINDKAVSWGQSQVHVMIMFSVNPNDKSRFYEVFENLIVPLIEPANIKKVAACKTYKHFVDTILSCI